MAQSGHARERAQGLLLTLSRHSRYITRSPADKPRALNSCVPDGICLATLRLVGGFVVDRLKTGAGHCNYEFAIPDVNHNTVEMRSQGQSFRAGPQITILPVLKESPAKCRAKN
jgi:hypothetical protein